MNKLKFISVNAMRQMLISGFSMATPLLVIHFSTKAVWGSFVSLLLFTLLALQIINWGNKEYLLRHFSRNPNRMYADFSQNAFTRFPLVFIFAIIGFFSFPPTYGWFLLLWLLGRFANHTVEVLVVYEKKFSASIVIESIAFGIFAAILLFENPLDLYSLLIFYSIYQFIKGIAYLFLFRKFVSVSHFRFDLSYYKNSLSFFLLSILGFLASKADVYLIEHLGNKTVTADYQIINSMLIFIMSFAAFIYAPFTKNIYRNSDDVIRKSGRLLSTIGLVLVSFSLLFVYLVVAFYLKVSLPFYFYCIAFAYVYPSFVYGIEIIDLFRLHNEKKVVIYSFLTVVVNCLLSGIFLYYGYGMIGALAGSAIAQIFMLILFKMNFIAQKRERFKRRKFYSKLIRKNDFCFDIGANTGTKSELFLSLGAKVCAFEPQSSCFGILSKVKVKHPEFDFHPYAVGANNSQMELRLANHSEVATLSDAFVDYFTNDAVFWNEKEVVTVRSLDSLIAEFGLPDFCKIDTEGYEFEILSHLSHKIPLIEFEFTGGFIDETIQIISLLDKGETRFNYILNENPAFRSNHWISGNEMKLIIESLPKNRLHGNIFVQSK